MLRASSTLPPMAKTSLHALAAATAPKSDGSSTRGGKKSVVETRATSSLNRYTAASSNGARPTSRLGASPASVLIRPSRGEAPHLAAQPPHDVHSVSFIATAAGYARCHDWRRGPGKQRRPARAGHAGRGAPPVRPALVPRFRGRRGDRRWLPGAPP